MTWCDSCETDTGVSVNNMIACINCGKVIVYDHFTDGPTFEKTSNGQTRLAGTRISGESEVGFSRERTLDKARYEIAGIANALEIAEGTENDMVNEAFRFYKIALDKNFTKGRRTCNVASACLYLACRTRSKPFLLIDFSNYLRINVYELGAVFLQLCHKLRLDEHPLVQSIIDPSFFIHRFTQILLGNEKGRNKEVSKIALQILASMKKNWMQTGRKPSGLCGAALYISSLSCGIKVTKSDIARAVYVCEATLSKRLIEFEDTESGEVKVQDFLDSTDSDPTLLPQPGELLCLHKDRDHFAHGLCEECHEFLKTAGGLQGGAEPPAFQRAERKRMEEKEHESGVWSDNEIEAVSSSTPVVPDSTGKEPRVCTEPQKTGNQSGDAVASNQSTNWEEFAIDDRETLSDIDDEEVAGYLHNEDEKQLKEIIWTEMNKEYLEEQAAKEAAAADSVPKVKKERKRRRAENNVPADTPLEATHQMLVKKKLSSKINYNALDALYNTDISTEKQNTDKTMEENGNDAANVVDGGFEEVDFGSYGNEDEDIWE